ncbi:hypothetical protein [Streptomyces radicis]|uniref:Uncharacterized protein n=1 Tax=Streptomyces radicis TaxID=1750517 RepID=A0A3A9VST3_9ACTN|nr:hypothetical protein [Streptomyces radicis]RKN03829.1 hypothetical protein D7319_30355 [Streptomyces radicis]RKN13932.1 hypothetical protein D7318_30250 [Streptomyces radicis]
MNDLPSDVPRLRALAAWLESQLGAVRKAIDAAEERDGPRWWVQWMRTAPGEPRRGVLHRAGCWCPGAPDLHLADARRVLAEHGTGIERCLVCRAEVTPQPPG